MPINYKVLTNLFILIYLTINPLFADTLISSIIVNDSVCSIKPINSENNYQINITENNNIKHIVVNIDSLLIQKLNLEKYQYQIKYNNTTYNSEWTKKPSFSIIICSDKNIELSVIAESENKTYTNNFTINNNNISANNYKIIIIAFLIFLIIAIYLTFRFILKKTNNKYNSLEQDYNILSKDYTTQKEEHDKANLPNKKSQRYKMVTILYASIQGFNNITEREDAKHLIDNLDRFFLEFDNIVERLHIEKIKTIGDTFMCAGGIPQKNRTNPIEVVLAAFEMQKYIENVKKQSKHNNLDFWNIKIGIHTGPVFCNPTNKKRLEIWGDTVNIASRVEASGEIGKVNITGMTYELIKDYFLCNYRGTMPVKYTGNIDIYFIEGFRPNLAEDKRLIQPNNKFKTKLGHLRFNDLEEFALNFLEQNLSKKLYYHNLKHTIDVTNQAEIIGKKEGISSEELLLLKTAALFHDIGFTKTYKDHEEAGVEIAKEVLPKYDYSDEQIKIISDIIMATKLPSNPKTLLEQIICDADLDYLGRDDFIPVSNNLFKELTEHNLLENNIDKWNKIQIDFIEKHSYFTQTAKLQRDKNKNNQLSAIRCLVK